MGTKTSMHRQGDLLIVKCESLPTAEELTERKNNVILEGEVTGHSHRLASGRVLEHVQGRLFLEVLTATQLVHEEHGKIDLEPGYYEVIRQREYVAPDITRMVVD
jgi:hypothetical protein